MGSRTPGEAAAAVARAFENASRVMADNLMSRFPRFTTKARLVVGSNQDSTQSSLFNVDAQSHRTETDATSTFASPNGHHVGFLTYQPPVQVIQKGTMAPALERARTAFNVRFPESPESASETSSGRHSHSTSASNVFGASATDAQNSRGTPFSTQHDTKFEDIRNSEDGGIIIDTMHRFGFVGASAQTRLVGSSDLALWDFELGGKKEINLFTHLWRRGPNDSVIRVPDVKDCNGNSDVTKSDMAHPFIFAGVHLDGWGHRTLECEASSGEKVSVKRESGVLSETKRRRTSWISSFDVRKTSTLNGSTRKMPAMEIVDVIEKNRVDSRQTVCPYEETEKNCETRGVQTKKRVAYKSPIFLLPLLRAFWDPEGASTLDDRACVEMRVARSAWEPYEKVESANFSDKIKVSDVADVRFAANVKTVAVQNIIVRHSLLNVTGRIKYAWNFLNSFTNTETVYAVAHELQLGNTGLVFGDESNRQKISLECEKTFRGTDKNDEPKIKVKVDFNSRARHLKSTPKLSVKCSKTVNIISTAVPWHLSVAVTAFDTSDGGSPNVGASSRVMVSARREFAKFLKSEKDPEKVSRGFLEFKLLFTGKDVRVFTEVNTVDRPVEWTR